MKFVGITETYRRTFGVLIALPLVWFSIFFLWPTINALVSLISIDAIAKTLSASSTWNVLWFTTWQAIISVIATFAVSMPVTWILARFTFPGGRWVRGIVSAPFVLPTVVVAAAVMALLPVKYQFGVHSIVIAHVLFNIAVVVRIVGQRWQMIPVSQSQAAATLGANPIQIFLHVTLPQLRNSLINAAIITFVFTFTSFGAVTVLGGVRYRTLEVEVYNYAVRLGQFDTAMVLSVLQVVIVATVLLIASASSRIAHTIQTPQVKSTSLSDYPRYRFAIWLIAICTSVLIALPFLTLFLRSFRSGDSWSVSAWENLWNGSLERVGLDIPQVIFHSVVFASIATAITIPFAYVVASTATYTKRIGGFIQSATSLPIVVSAVTLGFGIIVTFNRSPFDWRARTWLLPVVHALVALPLVVHILTPALRAISPMQREAAQTLGASPFRVWWHIDVQHMRRPLVAGAAMSFAVSLGEFGATSFLTRSSSTTLPIAISQLLGRPGTLLQNSGFALAALFAALTAVVMSRA